MAINRVTIMGNLTRDAELRKKGDATSVLTFGLAINEKKKDSETGEYVDAPVFVDCALFGARAEALAPYLTKGKKVFSAVIAWPFTVTASPVAASCSSPMTV